MKVEIKCTVVLEMIILDLFAVISCSFVRQGLCTVRHSDLAVSNGDYRFGTLNFEVSYTCNPGFTLYGHNQLTCFGMKWNYLPPMCIARNSVNDLRNTTISLQYQRKLFRPTRRNDFIIGSLIKFSCAVLNTLEGTDKLICDGTNWSDNVPTCKLSTTTKATTMTTTLLSTQPITSRTSATTTAPTIKPTTSTSSTTKLTTITTSQKTQTTTRKYVKTSYMTSTTTRSTTKRWPSTAAPKTTVTKQTRRQKTTIATTRRTTQKSRSSLPPIINLNVPKSTSPASQTKKEDNSNILYIIIGVGLVVVIAIVCVVAIYMYKKRKNRYALSYSEGAVNPLYSVTENDETAIQFAKCHENSE